MSGKEENKAKTPKVAVKKMLQKQEQQLVYCGPTLDNLQQYSVFKGNLPSHVDQYISKFPALRSLFVTPKDLAKTRLNVSIKGTRENQLFETIMNMIERGATE